MVRGEQRKQDHIIVIRSLWCNSMILSQSYFSGGEQGLLIAPLVLGVLDVQNGGAVHLILLEATF